MQNVSVILNKRDKIGLEYMSGPFFLGFAFECFGMGIVLILSINYFLSIVLQPKSPHESSRRLGVTLVAISLVFNLAQTAVDLARGWDMFATNFANIQGLLVATPTFFISPFLGLIPTTLTQLFLLRRITLFISSLDLLWPKLAHPITKYTFSCAIGFAILTSFVTGTISSVLVWKSGNLINLSRAGHKNFVKAEQTWLATSTAVDITLSLVLSIELWWARQKLGMQGGSMREIVTRLILVTCHGGLAVSGLQLASILFYNYWRFNAFCYLPILFLPKVYNITLILSLSVPHSTEFAPNPSHVFSLPTITDTRAGSPPNDLRAPTPRDVDEANLMHKEMMGGQGNIEETYKPISPGNTQIQPQYVNEWSEKRGINRWPTWSTSATPPTQIRNRHSIPKPSTYKRFSFDDRIDEERRPSDPNSICLLIPKEMFPNPSTSGSSPLDTILPSPPPTSITVQRSHSLSSSMTCRRPISMSFEAPSPSQERLLKYPQPYNTSFDFSHSNPFDISVSRTYSDSLSSPLSKGVSPHQDEVNVERRRSSLGNNDIETQEIPQNHQTREEIAEEQINVELEGIRHKRDEEGERIKGGSLDFMDISKGEPDSAQSKQNQL
ncbi:uncharacterized protein L201_000357 [Kwoniella dendrophila CBS 6074]|uniref:Uncharacterized protein n=1 Tax=Kwoniella dendrophila CBS 6074 TaxID=1295534 RepID=A0AAX4JKU8_9TREE